ncbi:MAG: NERD domain-containing protein [Trebonia sp.]
MAWPRIMNSRSSAQPGTQPHNGVQATVTPAPDAEPPPGSGHNTGVSGTRHTVAYDSGGYPPANDPAAARPRVRPRLRPIRYAHSGTGDPADPADTAGTADESPPPTAPPSAPEPDAVRSNTELPGTVLSGTVLPGTVLSGTVLPGGLPPDAGPLGEEPDDYDDSVGLVYEAPRPAHTEPTGVVPSDEPDQPAQPVPNEGLGIFGDLTTTEVADDAPARERPSRRAQPAEPPAPGPVRVIPVGAAWNQPVTSPPVASDGAEEGKPNSFRRMRGIRWTGPPPVDDHEPRVSVRDLPPDVQLGFWRVRIIIMVIVGAVFAVLTRNWEIALTLAILAGIVDTVRRSRNAASYANGTHPGARKETRKQLGKMRRDGYFALDARPIPNSREVIDHLVVGPTGVYAIDSEKWNPKLPVRTLNGKRLYLGPESQKDRLEHAVWEAQQASEILSAALGTEITVRPALAIYGPQIPWDIATIRNVDVFTGSALRKYLRRRGRMKEGVVQLTREEIRTIYDTASRTLPDVTESTRTATPVG